MQRISLINDHISSQPREVYFKVKLVHKNEHMYLGTNVVIQGNKSMLFKDCADIAILIQ